MGRRKGRKRQGRRSRRDRESVGAEALRRSEARRRRRRSADDSFAESLASFPAEEDVRALAWQEQGPRDLLAMVREDSHPGPGAKPKLTCDGCHEFIPNTEEVGRGRCLHPGSGVLAPWPDSEACQFHEARRRR